VDEVNWPGSLSIEFGGEALRLLPARAVWLPARQTVVVADVHLGKGAAFRSGGFPVPTGNSEKDLQRLGDLLRATGARRLVVLGDLVHARSSHQPELYESVRRWRNNWASTEVMLIRGNHDRSAGRVPSEWNIREVEEPFDDGGILFSHFPHCDGKRPVLAGHLHPVYSVRDFDGSSVRVPCFVVGEDLCAVLPPFGSLTGGHPVPRQEGRRIFLTSPSRVTPLLGE
jgi:DNA ligase-associated metallophosphoesterase